MASSGNSPFQGPFAKLGTVALSTSTFSHAHVSFVSHTPPLNARGVPAPPLRNVPVCRLWHPQSGVSNTVFAFYSASTSFLLWSLEEHTRRNGGYLVRRHYISSFTNHTTERSIHQCALLCYPRTIEYSTECQYSKPSHSTIPRFPSEQRSPSGFNPRTERGYSSTFLTQPFDISLIIAPPCTEPRTLSGCRWAVKATLLTRPSSQAAHPWSTLPHRTNPVASAAGKRNRPADHLDQSRHTFFLEGRENSTALPLPTPASEAD